jgi:hypothetical protein
MTSALVWSTESVLLGLWALMFSTYSTPLHVFVARSHVLISSFTLLLHLYVKSRGLVIGPAISQAFVCAVSALFLVYFSMLCVENSAARFFKMPSVGWLTLDACIGLAWFVVALISSVGMALSFVKKESQEKRTSSLMFNHTVETAARFDVNNNQQNTPSAPTLEQLDAPSAPPQLILEFPSAPTLKMLNMNNTQSRFSQQPSTLRYNLTSQLPDPAAVSISRRYLVDFMSKNV